MSRVQKFLLVVIILIILLIGILVAYLMNHKDEKITEDNSVFEVVPDNENKDEKTTLDLDINGDFCNDLYGKIPLRDGGFEPYFSGTNTIDTISDSQKLLFVLRRMEDNQQYDVVPNVGSGEVADVKKFELLNVEVAYRSVFGSIKGFEPMTVDTGRGYIYEYSQSSECFYGHTAPGGKISDYKYERNIDKIEQNDEGTEVYVYEKLLFFTNDENNQKAYALYKNTDKTDMILDNIKKEIVNGVTLYNGMELNDLFNEYNGQGGQFVHTFKKDENGNFYWYSTQYLK